MRGPGRPATRSPTLSPMICTSSRDISSSCRSATRMLHGVVTGLLGSPNVDYTRPIAFGCGRAAAADAGAHRAGSLARRLLQGARLRRALSMLPPGMRGGALQHRRPRIAQDLARTRCVPPLRCVRYAEEQRRAWRRAALLRELAGLPGGLPAADARKRHGAAAVARIVAEGLASLQADPLPGSRDNPGPASLPTPDQQQAPRRPQERDGRPAGNAARLAPPRSDRQRQDGGVPAGPSRTACPRTNEAIALVPEVALTPQMTERFEERFPGRVGLLHSRLTPRAPAGRMVAHLPGRTQRRYRAAQRTVRAGGGPRPDRAGRGARMDVQAVRRPAALPRARLRGGNSRRAPARSSSLGSATPDVVTAWRAERGSIGRLSMPGRIERSGAPTSLAKGRRGGHAGRNCARETAASSAACCRSGCGTRSHPGGRPCSSLTDGAQRASLRVAGCGFVMRCVRCSNAAYVPQRTRRRRTAAMPPLRQDSHGNRGRCPKCRGVHIRLP